MLNPVVCVYPRVFMTNAETDFHCRPGGGIIIGFEPQKLEIPLYVVAITNVFMRELNHSL